MNKNSKVIVGKVRSRTTRSAYKTIICKKCKYLQLSQIITVVAAFFFLEIALRVKNFQRFAEYFMKFTAEKFTWIIDTSMILI